MRADLGGPAACLDSLAPLPTGQDVGIFKLVNDGVYQFIFGAHDPSFTAEVHDQLVPLVASNPKHAGNSAQVWDVFLVIDFVEERLVLRIHIHTGDHQILCFSLHFYCSKGDFAVSRANKRATSVTHNVPSMYHEIPVVVRYTCSRLAIVSGANAPPTIPASV